MMSTDEATLRSACASAPLEHGPRLALADLLDELDRPQEACDERLRVALRKVCAEPDQDGPRLEYARVCRDYGRADRAEFIDVQLKMLEVPECTRPNKYGKITCRCPECVLTIRWMELLGPHTTPGEYGRNDWEWFAKNLTWATMHICSRGFVSEITCTAADWLAHADAIAWHPEQTVECPGCDGDCLIETDTSATGTVPCPACRSRGRVPRPFVATAQPIERVTLTTEPDVQAFGTIHAPLPGRQVRYFRRPGITFALPPEPV